MEPTQVPPRNAFRYVIDLLYEFRKFSMIASIVTVMLEVKIKSSEQTKRTLCGDVYIIRRYLFNLLANTPRPGKLNFRVAWAINI
jgi:hypothetical protein